MLTNIFVSIFFEKRITKKLTTFFMISIITATYNRSHTILRAIFSVLQQDITDWELIMIDDGSKDDTEKVIKDFLEKNQYLKNKIFYFYQENTGQAYALNAGIAKAKGEFITFLDSDDEYLPQHLALRLAYFAQNPHTDLIHGGLDIIGNAFVPDKYDTSKQIHIEDCVAGGTIFAKNHILQKLLFQKMPYSSDSDCVDRAILAGFVVDKVKYPTYRYYRDSADGICNNLNG